MKQYYIIAALAILAIAGVGCAESGKTKTEISVMRDLTEAQIAAPDASEIMALYPGNTWDERIWRYQSISDVSLNPATVFALAASGSRLLANSFERDKEAAAFEAKISTFLDTVSSDTVGRNNSSVYIPVAIELNRLAESDADTRILVLYTDLMENTADISFYRPKTLATLKTAPEEIRKKFDATVELVDLSSVRVYIVFQPRSPAEDETFRLVSTFYKTLLESKGATVTVAANLTN